MFTRIVEIESKPGKAKELCQMVEDKVVPIMRKLQGFKDEIVLWLLKNSGLERPVRRLDPQNPAWFSTFACRLHHSNGGLRRFNVQESH